MSLFLIVLASFLASAVEVVEAFTIVLAVGITRGWRTALIGAGAASILLVVLVAALGPSLILSIPIEVLQTLVGVLLLMFGLQWLRKAILRRSGWKSMHDEDEIFAKDVAALATAERTCGLVDWTGFTLAFKGVFLEGLEVAFIVLTFGTKDDHLALSALGAALACVLVVLAGVLVRRPLSRVPENDLKFAVGLMLAAFGTFWLGEGSGLEWTLGDGMLPVLVALYAVVCWALARWLTVRRARSIATDATATGAAT